MWLDEADGFAEIFKGYLPYYLLVALPIFIIMSPVNPVAASHEFSVYRMQHYDLHTVPHGCRSASFNLEGRSLTSWSTSRHCVVARVQDITIEQFMEIRSKAGALLLVLPKNDTVLTPEEKEHIQLLEMAMIQQEVNAPVYFARWTPDFEDILRDLQHSFITDDKSGTALEAMMNSVSSNGYQIVVSASTPPKLESKPVTLHGKLVGRSGSAQTIVIAAHYDSSAVVPELSQGADSNASGAVAVLELARIFSRLYSSTSVRGAPSLLFVLTSLGHSLNYFSAKKWLEEQLDSADASLLQDVSFVMCLDSISSSNTMTMHVSKPPKPGGAAHSIRSRLGVNINHKKINLADELLAWQHERFSIRRMTAFTLSSLQSHKDPSRSTVLDLPNESSINNLVQNIEVTARALASHIYNLTNEVSEEDAALYDDALNVEEASIRYWYKYLSSQSRAAQIITTTPPSAGVTGALERALSRYMDVTVSTHAVDKREPEYTLYGATRAALYVYSVKPAVFDLILTLAIVAYLTVVYFAIQLFPRFYEEFAKIVTGALNSLARSVFSVGYSTATSLQYNRTEYYLQYVLILADMTCPGTDRFMIKASKEGFFKAPYRWLLVNYEEDSILLNDVDILVDSDMVVVKRLGDREYLFMEAYKISENSEVIYTKRSMWKSIKSLHDSSVTENTGLVKKNLDHNTQNTSSDNEYLLFDSVNTSVVLQEARKTLPKITLTKYGLMEDYRSSNVLSSRRYNLRGCVLTMTNVITDSNDTRLHMSDRLNLHQDSITKMSYGVVSICFQMLNATERLMFTHTWGYKDKNGQWQGIVDQLVKKEADLGTLTIFTQERMMVVDYIAMVGSTAVRFVFREPPLSYISNIFALPFSGAVWLAIFICVLGCSIFLYLTSKWEATMGMHPLQLDGSWADVLILIIGAVLQQGCTLEPRYGAGRCVTLILFIALTILYAAYSANIVVLLRAPSSSVRSLPDLLNSPLKLGASDFEYNRYFFKKLNDPIRKAIYEKKIAPKGKRQNFYSMKDGVERIRKGLFAFHMELNPGYRLIQETYQEDEKCDLVEIDYINEIDPWVPGQKRSPFKDLFKINFLKIRESGVQANIHQRLTVPRPRCSGHVSTFSSVGITDMYPAMLMTLYGLLLAPAVLMVEILYKRLMAIRHQKRIYAVDDGIPFRQ